MGLLRLCRCGGAGDVRVMGFLGAGMLKHRGAEGNAVPTCIAASGEGSWLGAAAFARSLSHPGLSFCRVFTALRPALL